MILWGRGILSVSPEKEDNSVEEEVKTNEKAPVPYWVYEEDEARNERHIVRLIIALAIAVSMLFVSNLLWLYAWTSYDYTSTVTVDGKTGVANYIGNNGDIHNGEDSGTKGEVQEEPPQSEGSTG